MSQNDSTIDIKALRQSLRDPKRKSFKGKQFNRYDLHTELGRGGMGVVFRAKHRELGSLVALKLLAQQDPSPEAVARFRREARVLAQIKHPGVVGISDLGEDKGIMFLAMELIEGRSLQDILLEKKQKNAFVTYEEAVDITLQIAQALTHCHEVGAVHRDVKPHNVLVEHSTGRCVLTDFGLVKRDPTKLGQSSNISGAVSQAGKLLGTPSYMSPEQFEPEGEFGKMGPKTDVWSLGASLFYMLTGEPPFKASNVVNLYGMVMNDEVPKPSDRREGIPEALDEVVGACLTKNVEQRISMDQVASKLTALKQNLKLLKPRKSAGLRHALIVIAIIVLLFGLDLAVIHKNRGRRLWKAIVGGSDEVPGGGTENGGESDGGGAKDGEQTPDGADSGGEEKPSKINVALLEAQVEQGDLKAMVLLGEACAKGEGVKADPARARALFEQAAEKDHPTALLWLGLLYNEGRGVEKNVSQAKTWFAKAADAGSSSAMLWLGLIHKESDRAEAAAWFRRAITAGNEKTRDRARKELDRLIEQDPSLDQG